MLVGDLMSVNIPVLGPDDSVRDAARLMDQVRAKVLPVCMGERLIGVLTDSDVLCAVGDGCDPATEPVRCYMTPNVLAVTPNTSLEEAAQLMAHQRLHHLVVCEDGCFEGMLHIDVKWSELGRVATPHATFTGAA